MITSKLLIFLIKNLPHRNAADNDGVAIERLERDKRRTYPELVGSNRLRLTTLACETGGRWSKECTDTVRRLAKAKARHAREDQQAKLAAAYASRWWSLLSIAAQNSLAASLANDKPRLLDGVDGEEPDWQEVLYENQAAPLLPDEPDEETPEDIGVAGNSLEAAVVLV